jgi:AraC-like DNA-binding protein
MASPILRRRRRAWNPQEVGSNAQNVGSDPFLPLRSEREWFIDLIDRILARGWPRRARVCDARPVGVPPAGASPHVHAQPRLAIQLGGTRLYHLSSGGELRPYEMSPGDAIHWAPHAFSYATWDRPAVFAGLVFHSTFLRVLAANPDGRGEPAGPTPFAFHTSHPLGGPAQRLVQALSAMGSEHEPDEAAAAAVIQAILRLARRHLLEDRPDEDDASRARRSYDRVLAHLHQHYARPISREQVARELDLHPSYLSELCTARGGQSFQRTLEEIRLGHARYLLRHGDLEIARIAALCGYESSGSFIRAFRRAQRVTPAAFRRGSGG